MKKNKLRLADEQRQRLEAEHKRLLGFARQSEERGQFDTYYHTRAAAIEAALAADSLTIQEEE